MEMLGTPLSLSKRRHGDLHLLFEAGSLKIDPKSEKFALDRYLEQFPEYWRFNSNPVTISLTPK